MPDIPFFWLPAAVLLGVAVGWACSFESRRLAHEDMRRWRRDCLRTRAQRDQQRAENRRLRHRLAVDGINPHPTRPGRDGWPDPLPGDLRWDWPAPAPRRPLNPTDPQVFTVPAVRWAPTPDPLAWCWEPITDRRLALTGTSSNWS